MPKNIEQLLNSIGITDTAVIDSLLSDTESPESVDAALKAAQAYARPFVESDLNTRFNDERKTLKGKYFNDLLHKANKEFGNPLSQKEIDEILKDPAHDGKSYDAALAAMKAKVSEKTGAKDSELQKMLDLANGKISDFEKQIPELEGKYKKQYDDAISQFKIDGIVSKKLVDILTGKTSMEPTKAAELLKGQLSRKAIIKLKEDGNIGLYDLVNNETPLKRNETTLETFEGVVDGLITEYGLAAKSKGTDTKDYGSGQKTDDTKPTGLAAKMAAVTAE